MNKKIIILVKVFFALSIGGIYVAAHMPRPQFSDFDSMELSKILAKENAELPYKYGTVGSLDSMYLSDKTIVYSISVNGSDEIMKVYKENYYEVEDLLKYSFVMMNGQRNLGSVFADVLNDMGLNIQFRIYSASGCREVWNITGKELSDFVSSWRDSPTAALNNIIDIDLKRANLELPLDTNSVRSLSSVALNSVVGEVDARCLLQSISSEGSDIVFCYKVYESDLEYYQTLADPDAMDGLVRALAKDDDMRGFMDLLVMSHSDLVFTYEGDESGKSVMIRIPYTILGKYCNIPSELLSNY